MVYNFKYRRVANDDETTPIRIPQRIIPIIIIGQKLVVACSVFVIETYSDIFVSFMPNIIANPITLSINAARTP